MPKVAIQIGSIKNKKKTQSIRAYVNDEELTWVGENPGTFLSSMKDRKWKGMTWYLCKVDVDPSDVLKIVVKTYLIGVGLDQENTFESLYYADNEAPVREIALRDVGMKGYPLIKGRVLEIGSVSEEDKRKADIADFLNEGF